MNKLEKYRKSLNDFISKNEDIIDINDKYDNIIKENIDKNLYEPIIALAILGKHTKKNEIILHGYHIATCIEMIYILIKIVENNKKYIKKFGNDIYSVIIVKIISIINRSLLENIDSMILAYNDNKNNKKKTIFKPPYLLLQILNVKITEIIKEINFVPVKNNVKELHKIHFEDEKIKEIALKNKIIDKSQLDEYINTRYCKLCELAILFGLVIGSCNSNNISELELMSKTLGTMIKIARDFKNIENDIKESNGITLNVVLNLGLTKSFDLYQKNKVKFNTIKHDSEFMTPTIKEIISNLDESIDELIDTSDSVSIETYTLQS